MKILWTLKSSNTLRALSKFSMFKDHAPTFKNGEDFLFRSLLKLPAKRLADALREHLRIRPRQTSPPCLKVFLQLLRTHHTWYEFPAFICTKWCAGMAASLSCSPGQTSSYRGGTCGRLTRLSRCSSFSRFSRFSSFSRVPRFSRFS